MATPFARREDEWTSAAENVSQEHIVAGLFPLLTHRPGDRSPTDSVEDHECEQEGNTDPGLGGVGSPVLGVNAWRRLAVCSCGLLQGL